MNKRRRYNDPIPNEHVQGTAEGYDQWNEDPQHPQGSQAFISAADPPTFTTRSEYDHSAVVPTESNAKGDSQWASHESSYPEVAGYQQQPYFYQQTANPNPATYNSSWTSSEPHPYGSTGAPPAYSVGQRTSATSMPYFPSQTSAPIASTTKTVDGTAAIGYSDLEHTTQYAYSKPSALVTAAQREAAKQSSAFYFDDAGMPLKIQSLPILDNLVRGYFLFYNRQAESLTLS